MRTTSALLLLSVLALGACETASTGVQYFTTLDTAAGLKVGTPVEIAGIPIGQVSEITRSGKEARVALRIRPDVSLPLDSRVIVDARGVLGDRVVTIKLGDAEQMCRAGDQLLSGGNTSDMTLAINNLVAITEDLRAISAAARADLDLEKPGAAQRARTLVLGSALGAPGH